MTSARVLSHVRMRKHLIQAPMNLSHVVTIGTFRGGSVGGLEEGKGVQLILGRKNPQAKSRSVESCTQKMRLGFSQIYHHLLKLLTSLFDILQPFSEISSINLKFIPLKLMTILRSEKTENIRKSHDLTFLQNGISPGRDFLMFLITSQYFWQKISEIFEKTKIF